jgi:hypothetical protein
VKINMPTRHCVLGCSKHQKGFSLRRLKRYFCYPKNGEPKATDLHFWKPKLKHGMNVCINKFTEADSHKTELGKIIRQVTRFDRLTLLINLTFNEA